MAALKLLKKFVVVQLAVKLKEVIHWWTVAALPAEFATRNIVERCQKQFLAGKGYITHLYLVFLEVDTENSSSRFDDGG